MKTFKNVVAGASILIGAFFLINSASDIQLGFGLVLITNGMLGIQGK